MQNKPHIMRFMLLCVILWSSVANGNEVCRIDFTHDNKNIDEQVMAKETFWHELYVRDALHMKTDDGSARRFMWWTTGVCPKCSEMKARTVNAEGASEWVSVPCQPTALEVCK